MTADTDDSDDGQLEELQERVEALEGASETLAETLGLALTLDTHGAHLLSSRAGHSGSSS